MLALFRFGLIILLSTLSSCKTKNYMQEMINKSNYNYQNSFYPKDVKEVKTPIQLNVIGRIPVWLRGKLFQNSAGKFSIDNHKLTHRFDGFSFVSAFEFKKGNIYYSGAFIKSDQFMDSMKDRRLHLLGFSQNFGDPEPGHVSWDGQKVKTANPNVNISKVGNHWIALGETPLPVEFSPDTLETIGFFDYSDKLKKAKMWEGAHIKRDPETGALYNFYIDYGMRSYYVLYKIVEGKTSRELIAKHRVSEPSYMHDFSITKNYIILTAYPLIVDSMDLLNLFKPNSRYSFIGAHRWEPERGTIVYVFDKSNGKLLSQIKTEPKFAFHHINAFEDKEGKINLYLNTFDSADIVLTQADPSEQSQRGKLEKLLIDPKNSEIKLTVLSNNSYEMPKIKDDLVGRENKYFYAVWYNARSCRDGFGLVKYDLSTCHVKSWVSKGLFPGEPIFIQNPLATREDDGVIVSTTYDKNKRRSVLIILDAHSMKELSRAYLSEGLSPVLHGKFMYAA